TLRRGWGKAVQFYLASFFRVYLFSFFWGRAWMIYGVAYLSGLGLMYRAWQGGGMLWPGILHSLCGLAIGGCIVWAVRISGTLALKKEAMGFGDVTLLAMIGAF